MDEALYQQAVNTITKKAKQMNIAMTEKQKLCAHYMLYQLLIKRPLSDDDTVSLIIRGLCINTDIHTLASSRERIHLLEIKKLCGSNTNILKWLQDDEDDLKSEGAQIIRFPKSK